MNNILDISGYKIYVTGATGWIGRTFLHELQAMIPATSFNNTVVAFGSKETYLKSTNYQKDGEITIPIKPLSKLRKMPDRQNILLFHAAFLTRDRISKHGVERFIEINQEITSTVLEFLTRCGKTRVAHMSSGAAFLSESRNSSNSEYSGDAYGHLKLNEEKKIAGVTTCQSFRVYALTGRFIRDPEKFAIGDFLLKAVHKKSIVINSACPVIRSYVSASDLTRCAIRWLVSFEKANRPVPSTSHTITLESLANLITKRYRLPKPVTKKLIYPANTYSCSPIYFDSMLRRYGIKPLTLAEQIEDTAKGLLLT